MQFIDQLNRRAGLLNVLLRDKKELLEDAKAKGSHGCSDHEAVELKTQRRVRETELQSRTSEEWIWG